jgi:hypothetical protein
MTIWYSEMNFIHSQAFLIKHMISSNGCFRINNIEIKNFLNVSKVLSTCVNLGRKEGAEKVQEEATQN